MSTNNINICKLEDLDKLRSAPKLNKKQSKTLLNQLSHLIHKSDWITIGVMSPSLKRKPSKSDEFTWIDREFRSHTENIA